MLRIGLTGGIGSGKTTVARLFGTMGVPVYVADEAAKRLLNQHTQLRQAVMDEFGPACYPNGQLDRSYLASVVFNDPEKLARLNQLVHPVTIEDANNWLEHQQGAYAIREAALLFESGAAEGIDYVIGVSAPASLRMERVMRRDRTGADEVRKRMQHQLHDTIKLKLCDFVVINDDVTPLLPQVLALDKKFRELAAQPTQR